MNGSSKPADEGGLADLRGVDNKVADVTGVAVQAGSISGDVVIQNVRPVAERPTPCEVPLLSSRYINRDAEFALVREALAVSEDQPIRIALVTGMPGVGKSAFIRRLAERMRDTYSGGQLYVDFAATKDQSSTGLGDVLARFLRALGVPSDAIPGSVEEQTTMYRTLTAGRRTLVVLDEVTEPGQVRALVPNSRGSAVLVASNNRLSELLYEGAEVVPLEPLDDEGGARLVVELSGRRDTAGSDALAELVRLCGGLPVALQVAAARLRDRPSLEISRLVEEIAQERSGLGAFTLRGERRVAAVFSVAYQGLSAEAARMYRVLGVLDCPVVPVDVAAAAAGIGVGAAEDALDHLVQASLLGEDGASLFRIHGLVRRHAADCARTLDLEADRVEVLRRAVVHVTTWAAFADLAALGAGRFRVTPLDVVLDGPADPFADVDPKVRERRALDWMDNARDTALTMLRVAADRGWFDQAWQLAEAMTALFVVRRYLIDWTRFSELGARAAQSVGNAAAEARLRSFMSRAWTDLGDLPRARRELDHALALAKPLGQPRLLATIWELEGRYRDHTGDRAQAISAYRSALTLFSQVDDERGTAFVTYFLGTSLLGQGDATQALDVLNRARDLIHSVGNDRMEGRALTSIGATLARLGRPDDALAVLAEALTLLAAGGYQDHVAKAHETVADAHESRGALDQATESLRRAAAIYDTVHSPQADRVHARLAALSRDEASPGSSDAPDPPES